MEIFENFIETLNELANYKYLATVIFAVGITLIVTQILVLIICIIKKYRTEINSVRYFSKCLILISVVLSFIENINSGFVFKNLGEVVLYNGCLIAFSLLFFSAFSIVSEVKQTKNVNNKNVKNYGENLAVLHSKSALLSEEDNQNIKCEPTNVKNVLRLKCEFPKTEQNEFDGYLNVPYLRSLISILKEKNLTETDCEELENFEVYLMNFASRQPYPFERQKLSGYLSDFIKKLARYNAV